MRIRRILLLIAGLVLPALTGCHYQPRLYGSTANDPLFADDHPPNGNPLPPDGTPINPIRNSPWKYIIVHHSATEFGSAAEFDRLHKERGWQGVGYHFVIGNGTRGTADGQIEPTYRWTRQLAGAHCKANDMNERGIGICLVGDFTDHQPSRAQLLSLIRLVRVLQQRYLIPADHVIGHGKVDGASTECPGKSFPWESLQINLLKIPPPE